VELLLTVREKVDVRPQRQHLLGVEALTRFDMPGGHGPDEWFRAAHAEGLGVELDLQLSRRSWTPPAAWTPGPL